MFGLSGSIITQVKVAFFPDDGVGFILFLALLCSLLPLAMTPCMNLVPIDISLRAEARSKLGENEDAEKKQLMRGFVPEVILLVYLLSLSVLQISFEFGTTANFVFLAVLTLMLGSLALLCSDVGPLSYPRDFTSSSLVSTKLRISEGNDAELEDSLLASNAKESTTSIMTKDLSASDLIVRLDFWLVFIALTCGFGSGLMVVNNIAQIARAAGDDGRDNVSVIVSLYSIGSACGRLGYGLFTDLYAKDISRLMVLTTMLALMAVVNVGLAFSSFEALCVFIPLIGLSFGAQAAASPIIVFELWGETYFGQNYGVLLIGPLLGSLALSTFSASSFYERFADDDPDDDEYDSLCDGARCFQAALLINAATCAFGTVCCFWVTRMSRVEFKANEEKAG